MSPLMSLFAPLLMSNPAFAGKFSMPAASPAPIEATPVEATIVFFRPSKYGRSKPVIVDGNGRIVAQMIGSTHYVHRVPAGSYSFTVWGEATPTLHATVEAGEIYYVKMDASVGAWTARFPLVATGPSRDGWEKMSDWLGRTTQWHLDPGKTEAYRQDRANDIKVVLEKGQDRWAGYDAERKANRTITPDDGVTQPVR